MSGARDQNREHRFARLEELYHRLVATDDPSERDQLLEVAGRDDPELAADARRLLNAASAESDRELLDIVHGEPGADPHDEAPRRIGPYTLLRPLGKGGMGVVYEAQQEEPIRRRVALKLMLTTLRGARAVARFEAERQSLALMTHPGIAQIYDAGQSANGRPYVVMELVEGQAITEYCDRRALDLRARLELFTRVCDGVQHAHQKGVIHRDLKPSNILVTEQEGRARPKVIDFGIAKAFDLSIDEGDEPTPATARAGLTRVGEMVGTLETMSPEQVRGLPVDTRSDVYALGVLLYELLVGELPFRRTDDTPGSTASLRQAILERPPERPSTRQTAVRRDDSITDDEPDRRPTRFSMGRIDLELDLITLKALEKEPEKRYDSVERLADDVRRYLGGLPVHAHPPGLWYRVRKFARRNTVATLATLLVLLAVAVGTVSLAVGLSRARAAERERAQEAALAQQVSDFLTALFQEPDPLSARGEMPSARDILDRGLERLEDEDAEPLDREVRARLLSVIADTYVSLGLVGEAKPLLEESAGLYRALGDRQLDLARVERLRGMIALDFDRDPAAARPHLEESRALLEQYAEPDEFEWVPLFTDLADLASQEGDYEAAIPWAERALETLERHHPDAPTLPRVRSNLATNYLRLGHYEQAVPLLEQEVARWRSGAIDDAEIADALQVLGATYGRLGRLREGLDILTEGAEIDRRVFGENHANLGSTLYTRGLLLESLGELAAATVDLEEAVALSERQGLINHPNVLFSLQALGRINYRRGETERGRANFARALDVAHALRSQPYFSPLRVLQGSVEMEAALGEVERAHAALASGLGGEEDWLERDPIGEGLLLLERAILTRRAEPSAAEADFERATARLAEAARERPLIARRRAAYFVAAADLEAAHTELERLRDLGYRDAWVASDPTWDPLREDREAARLLESMLPAG